MAEVTVIDTIEVTRVYGLPYTAITEKPTQKTVEDVKNFFGADDINIKRQIFPGKE